MKKYAGLTLVVVVILLVGVLLGFRIGQKVPTTQLQEHGEIVSGSFDKAKLKTDAE